MLNAVSMSFPFLTAFILWVAVTQQGELYTFFMCERKILRFSRPLCCNIQSRLRIITDNTTKCCG